MYSKRKIFFSILFAFFTICAFSQEDSIRSLKDSSDFYEMSLEELINLKAHGVPSELEEIINSLIEVSSKKPLNTRESPSVISLITEEDIKKSGARDLIDVLRLVPGIEFGVDVEGVVGMGIRGNWSQEGKVLVLLDGQEMNEIISTCNYFGNHFPIEHIKKIEIIRGPGSAIYGGYAEHGVINIVTRQAEDINGFQATGVYSQMEKGLGRRNLNLALGRKFNDFWFSFSGLIGEGQRSDQDYKDFAGNSYNMNGNSSLNPNYFNFALGYKGLSIRTIGDFYKTTMRSGYGNVIPQGTMSEEFNSSYSELKYDWKINKKLRLVPRINFKIQTPWKVPAYDADLAYHRQGYRISRNLNAYYDPNRNVNLIVGVEAYLDRAVDKVDSSFFQDNKKEVSYHNISAFTQALIKTRVLNFILGARYDRHNAFGDAFVPRVGIMKRYNRFHFKALYSKSFRAPSIENFSSADSTGIKPEFSEVIEVEVGYQLSRNSFLVINAFDITTKNPIVYYTSMDSLNSDFYSNLGSCGTQGIELEFKQKEKWGHFILNYAYYTAANKPNIYLYETPSSESMLGFANHKINLNLGFNISKHLSFNATANFFSSRWAVTGIDSLSSAIYSKLDPTFLINCFVNYEIPDKGFRLGFGVYDLMNEKLSFIQPYNGGHAPLPGSSREFIVKLNYQFKFKKAK